MPLDAPGCRAYRERLLPLLDEWRRWSARLAVFGTGPHTDLLLRCLPELDGPLLAVFVESRPAAESFRGRPVVAAIDVAQHADIVICSSFTREVEQLGALDALRVKGVLSHPPSGAGQDHGGPAAPPAEHLLVPTFGYPVCVPEYDREPFDCFLSMFEAGLGRMKATVDRLRPYFAELSSIPDQAVNDVTPYWDNGYFSGDDARILHGIIRADRPRRIVEIGSGNSTKFMRHAIAANGGGTHLTSIDPAPRAEIDRLCDEVIRQPLQSVSPGFFDRLGSGDLLFFDGSHLVFPGSDCVSFFLRVLPRVAPGVLVHVDDIHLPYGYPPDFQARCYNEQYLLGAFLLYNDAWRVEIASAFLGACGVLVEGRSSFWMARR